MEQRATPVAAKGGKEKGKVKNQQVMVQEEDDEEEEEEKREKIATTTGTGRKISGSVQKSFCQAEKCSADLTSTKLYYRRHKVCEGHSKAAVVIVAGLHQRFCQQCSRFHEVAEFDGAKRSCRRRLAGHNERRRKNSTKHTVGSSRRN